MRESWELGDSEEETAESWPAVEVQKFKELWDIARNARQDMVVRPWTSAEEQKMQEVWALVMKPGQQIVAGTKCVTQAEGWRVWRKKQRAERVDQNRAGKDAGMRLEAKVVMAG